MYRYTLKQQWRQIALFAKVFIGCTIGLCVLIWMTGFQVYSLPIVQVDLTYLPIIGLFALAGFTLWLGFGFVKSYYRSQKHNRYPLMWIMGLTVTGIGFVLLDFAILMTGGYVL